MIHGCMIQTFKVLKQLIDSCWKLTEYPEGVEFELIDKFISIYGKLPFKNSKKGKSMKINSLLGDTFYGI